MHHQMKKKSNISDYIYKKDKAEWLFFERIA